MKLLVGGGALTAIFSERNIGGRPPSYGRVMTGVVRAATPDTRYVFACTRRTFQWDTRPHRPRRIARAEHAPFWRFLYGHYSDYLEVTGSTTSSTCRHLEPGIRGQAQVRTHVNINRAGSSPAPGPPSELIRRSPFNVWLFFRGRCVRPSFDSLLVYSTGQRLEVILIDVTAREVNNGADDMSVDNA